MTATPHAASAIPVDHDRAAQPAQEAACRQVGSATIHPLPRWHSRGSAAAHRCARATGAASRTSTPVESNHTRNRHGQSRRSAHRSTDRISHHETLDRDQEPDKRVLGRNEESAQHPRPRRPQRDRPPARSRHRSWLPPRHRQRRRVPCSSLVQVPCPRCGAQDRPLRCWSVFVPLGLDDMKVSRVPVPLHRDRGAVHPGLPGHVGGSGGGLSCARYDPG